MTVEVELTVKTLTTKPKMVKVVVIMMNARYGTRAVSGMSAKFTGIHSEAKKTARSGPIRFENELVKFFV